MVEKLNFSSKEEAQILRNEYFEKYHSTSKGLVAAEDDGRLPPLPEGVTLPPGRTRLFYADDLDKYWADNLDYSILGGPDVDCVEALNRVAANPSWGLKLIVFSNGPRRYVLRALREIGLDGLFPPENVYAVTDILPHCKPDEGSFDLVLKRAGAQAEECVMVEDSMKNMRVAKALGMRTVLVAGRGSRSGEGGGEVDRGFGQNARDAPDETDPAVDAVVEVAAEIEGVLNKWLG
ncbi:hypothetical protein ACHAWF_013856 [Thalassiosira exigua]